METDTTASDKDSKLLIISGSAAINTAAGKFWSLNPCFSLETFGIVIYEKQTRLNVL